MASIKCPKCGYEFSETVQRCYYCGTILTNTNDSGNITNNAVVKTNKPIDANSNNTSQQKNNSIMTHTARWLAIGVFVALFAIAILLYLLEEDYELFVGRLVIGIIILAIFLIGILMAKLNQPTSSDAKIGMFYEGTPLKNTQNRPAVECPYCHSRNTSKISNISKAIGTAMIGVHSIPRNMKQWHCNNCGSDF